MQTTPQLTLGTAILRGIRCRCPNCGAGKLFVKFLRVADTCPNCGEELHHHRADDLPAYLVILILGHILVPGVVILEVDYHPAYWVQAAIWLPLIPILALILLQPCKGAVVAVEWYNGMRGFAPSKERRLALAAKNSEII
jgi:uncharacterized protein (DUF983 family)